MSIPKYGESISEFRFYFIFGALLFFAIPIPMPAPETYYLKQFRNFTIRFNKTYHQNVTEFQKRYQIFEKNVDMIKDLRQGNLSDLSVFGINGFSDLSIEEFAQQYLVEKQFVWTNKISLDPLWRYELNNFGNGPCPLPQSVDWRRRGIITSVRNQGECSSCYAHSVIASIEAMHALKWNFSPANELSVQQMIDCPVNSSFGCQGGDTCNLLGWLKESRMTIFPKLLYEVLGSKSACRNDTVFKAIRQTVNVKDYTCSSFVGQEHEMLALLAFKGPLIAAVDALPWQNYVGGVIKENCNGPTNHAVQIVGYDLSGDVDLPHFIVRNSWGTNFGHQGYAKIAIGENVCGIAEEVSTVTVD